MMKSNIAKNKFAGKRLQALLLIAGLNAEVKKNNEKAVS